MSEVSDNEYETTLEMMQNTIRVVLTPEVDEDELETGLFHLYTVGMRENFDLQEMEMRNVPGMFAIVGSKTLTELAAYQYDNRDDSPILVGHTVGWDIGDMVVTNGEDWDGLYSWTSEEMLRFESRQTTVHPGPNCLPGEP